MMQPIKFEMAMKRVLISLLLIASTCLVFGADTKEMLQSANESYRSNNFAQAIETYEAILDQGFESKAIYYNLGNAYYRQNQLGKAILNYERAQIKAPKDADIKHNLKVARQQLKGDLEVLPEFFLTHWWHNTRMGLSASGWGIVALLLLWLGLAGLIVWILVPTRKHKKLGFVLGILLLILFVLPFSLALSRASFEKNTEVAIVTEPEAILRAGPDEESTTVLELQEGTKVFLLDQIDNWYRVRLSNSEEGWLLAEKMEEI
jgi:tetratricopeptide (TPR) repeat protein